MCSVENPESDRRRTRISELSKILRKEAISDLDPGDALKFCKEKLQLLKEEDISDMQVSHMYSKASRILLVHGDLARASAMASLAMKHKIECQVANADGMEEIQTFIESPQSSQVSRESDMWRTRTSQVRAPMSEGFEEWLWERAK